VPCRIATYFYCGPSRTRPTDVAVALLATKPFDEQARLVSMVHEESTDGLEFVFHHPRLGSIHL
jgi:hypothetical protein